MQQQEVLSVKEFYDYAVRQLERELSLINNRLSWMLTFQGFLFTTTALVSNRNTERAVRMVFRNVVPLIGIVVALLALIGVHAAHLSIRSINAKWKQKLGHWEYLPTFSPSISTVLGKIPSYGIPISIIIAWFLLRILLV